MRRLSISLFPVLVTVLLTATACPKKKAPSAEYEEAHSLFSRLYAQKMNDAFVDPQMSQVEELLAKVPADSVDAPAAAELRKRIADGKAERAQANADVETSLQRPTEAPRFAPSSPTPESPSAADAPDASVDEPVPGMTVAELTRRFGSCFAAGEPLLVQGQGMTETYVLRDMALCRQKFPLYVNRGLLFRGGKYFAAADLTKIEMRLQDGGLPPDAGR